MRLTTFQTLLFLLLFSCNTPSEEIINFNTKISLDQELLTKEKKAINSSTQSINRYTSSLRELNNLDISINKQNQSIALKLKNSNNNKELLISNIDATFLVPLLPYPRKSCSKFDIANIILAEYARNGISIPIQQSNNAYASVTFTNNLFNQTGEYQFLNGKYSANPMVLPKRINIINNCLKPGLWEISASDAVGEMYHGWHTLSQDFYNELLSSVTGIPEKMIPKDFDDPAYFDNVRIPLEQLRSIQNEITVSKVMYNAEKEIGAYSGQDSRRKVQRNFSTILRNEEKYTPTKQGELQEGDVFSLFSFEEPGIYNDQKKTNLTFTREWDTAHVLAGLPKTKYPGQMSFVESEYIEIQIFNKAKDKALIIGNIPLTLLTFGNDFEIPSFGVGVFKSSENIERRYLRKNEGPHPSFAYLANFNNDEFSVINNHHYGYEQLYLRPKLSNDRLLLTITIVSYERITDLVEFEIDISPITNEVLANSKNYRPPIYLTYLDDNTL